jgi:hypothetical protein
MTTGTSKKIRLGTGVSREPDPEAAGKKKKPETTEQHPEPKAKLKGGKETWADTPSFEDQFSKYPQTVNIGPRQFKRFDMSKDTDLLELNKFYQGTVPESAPSVYIAGEDKQFCEATQNWKILVAYHTLRYKILIKQ